MPLAYFRAFIGAVSLKLDGVAHLAGARGYFRAFIGAVSLKQARLDAMRSMAGEFPRLHRRGLIEALIVRWKRRLDAPNFRAFIGAVSLKHPDPIGEAGGLGNFRAFIGAVSLKHHGDRAVARGPADFRAFIGAVSLKQLLRQRPGAIPHDFRAFIGAVSLKPGDGFGGEERPAGFPRLHRRGLIEAFSVGAG